jgi:hypothetical protein
MNAGFCRHPGIAGFDMRHPKTGQRLKADLDSLMREQVDRTERKWKRCLSNMRMPHDFSKIPRHF